MLLTRPGAGLHVHEQKAVIGSRRMAARLVVPFQGQESKIKVTMCHKAPS